MVGTGTTAPPDLVTPRHFLLRDGKRVVYVPTKDENEDASLNFIGKKLNWITEYYVIDKSFPRIVQELEGNDNLLSPPEPTGDKSKPPHTLKGSTRTGLFVLADEGEPPPTREQRDIFDVDLTTCR